jgi:hypothetical protein
MLSQSWPSLLRARLLQEGQQVLREQVLPEVNTEGNKRRDAALRPRSLRLVLVGRGNSWQEPALRVASARVPRDAATDAEMAVSGACNGCSSVIQTSAAPRALMGTTLTRRPLLCIPGALSLHGFGRSALDELVEAKGRKRRKHRAHQKECRKRRRHCRRENKEACANCYATPPPPPPDWTGTADEWVDDYCGVVCLDFCSFICSNWGIHF